MMHDLASRFHLDVPFDGHVGRNVSSTTLPEDTQDPSETLLVPAGSQWVATTLGRIVTDPYSWMQAVHWFHGAGLYQPARKHGPRFGDTTVRLAQALADLNPCRPTIRHLMRRLKVSERTVQYHLEILRDTGLLAYLEKGTRYPAPEDGTVICRASHFVWVVPTSFDAALGIRVLGEGSERRAVGIAEEHRSTIGKLARKAARRVRRPRRRKALCTPMVGGTDHGQVQVSGEVITTGAARVENQPTQKTKAKPAAAGPKRTSILGATVTAAMMVAGDKLARAAYRAIPWVRKASHDQLRWVSNDAADKGWTEHRYLTWLREIAARYGYAGTVWAPERPHALIAHAWRSDAAQDAEDAVRLAVDWDEPTAEERRQQQENLATLTKLFGPTSSTDEQPEQPVAVRTDEDRRRARLQGEYRIQRVLDHLSKHGFEDTVDLYGLRLTCQADRIDAIGGVVPQTSAYRQDGIYA